MKKKHLKEKIVRTFLLPPSSQSLSGVVAHTGLNITRNRQEAEFVVRHGTDVVCIHSLHHDGKAEIVNYLAKLDVILKCIQEFELHVGAKLPTVYREWLNPLESGATGSVAYEVNSSRRVFELASCEGKVRFVSRNHAVPAVVKLAKTLQTHRQHVLDMMETIQSENGSLA